MGYSCTNWTPTMRFQHEGGHKGKVVLIFECWYYICTNVSAFSGRKAYELRTTAISNDIVNLFLDFCLFRRETSGCHRYERDRGCRLDCVHCEHMRDIHLSSSQYRPQPQISHPPRMLSRHLIAQVPAGAPRYMTQSLAGYLLY